MTPADANTLQALAELLRDNLGNRITPVLINGMVNTLHDHIAARARMSGGSTTQPPSPTGADAP